MKVFELGDIVLTRRTAPARKSEKYFVVEWPSFWGLRSIEVGITAVRRGNSWTVRSLEIPDDTPPEDARDIALCSWRIFSGPVALLPSVYAAWGIKNPPVVIAACQAPPSKPVRARNKIAWQGKSFIDFLRGLGPAVCAVVSSKGIVEFDITHDGFFLDRLSHPGKRFETVDLMNRLSRAVAGGDAKANVCKFSSDTITFKGRHGETIFIPIRELSSYLISFAGKSRRGFIYRWEKLPSHITELSYCFDWETRSYGGLTIDRRINRFV